MINNVSSGTSPIFYPNEQNDVIQDAELELTTEQEEKVSQYVQNKTLTFQHECRLFEKLSLEEAKEEIGKVVQGKVVKFLSPLNILFVEVLKVVKQLGDDRKILQFFGEVQFHNGKQLIRETVKGSNSLNLLSVELHVLFKTLQGYQFIYEGRSVSKPNRLMLFLAQETYYKVYNYFQNIEGMAKKARSSMDTCSKLKKYCEVLYHLCQDEDMLKKCTKSISPNLEMTTSVLAYPPTQSNMQFYLDSLDVWAYSLSQYHLKIENDYKMPLTNAIAQLKKISKNDFEILELNPVITSIAEFITSFDTLNAGKPLLYKTHAEACIKNECNTPLNACFQNLYKDGMFLPTLKKMNSLVEEMSVSWELYKTESRNFSKLQNNIAEAFSKFNISILSLESAVGKKKIHSKTRIALNKLITPLKKLSCVETFGTLFDAFIDQSARASVCTFQEMQFFFFKMNILNHDSDAFQKSLLPSEKSKFPCSSFNPLDLWVLQLFEYLDSHGEKDDIQDCIKEIYNEQFFELIQRVKLIRTASVLTAEIDKEEFREDIIEILHYIINSLSITFENKSFEEIGIKGGAIKSTSFLLAKYLNNFQDFPIFRLHLEATLLHPCSTEHEISGYELPLIRQLMHMIVCHTEEKNITRTVAKLRNEVEKTLTLAPLEAKFFWELNLKYVILAELALRNRQRITENCNKSLQNCKTPEESLRILHELKKQMKPIENSSETWAFQLSLIGIIAVKEDNNHIIPLCEVIAKWHTHTTFHLETINDIAFQNKAPKKLNIARIKQVEPLALEFNDTESTGSEEPIIENQFSVKQETYSESPYEGMRSFLKLIQDQQIPATNPQEPLESIVLRTAQKDALVQNSYFYLTLIEEAKQWRDTLPLELLKREQVDQMLLLEAAEKIALSYSKEESPYFHITHTTYQKRPLMYTHNGEEIVTKVNRTWFDHPAIQSSIQSQDSLLKKAYWFQTDIQMIDGINEIVPCCLNVWKQIINEKSFTENLLGTQVQKFKDCLFHIHKLKNAQNSVPPFLSSLDADALISKITQLNENRQVDPKCYDIAKEHSSAIVRVFDLYQALSEFGKNGKMPLFFTMRIAEIQVSLLTSVLILALSSLKADKHPLLQENEDRPLAHVHRVDKLWAVLKEYAEETMNAEDIKMLDTYLPLFVGDPRYPLSKERPLTQDLVKMYERVYLLQKITQGGWFNKEDPKLLSKHLGKEYRLLSLQDQKEILEKKILKGVQEQQMKTLLALQLAGLLVKPIK